MRQVVDYTLAKRAVLHEWRTGRRSLADICDAHPELIRAAESLGAPIDRPCPVCARPTLCSVSYVFGDTLKGENGRLCTEEKLERLLAAHDEFVMYTIEVCTSCSWNHLASRYVTGKAHAS